MWEEPNTLNAEHSFRRAKKNDRQQFGRQLKLWLQDHPVYSLGEFCEEETFM